MGSWRRQQVSLEGCVSRLEPGEHSRLNKTIEKMTEEQCASLRDRMLDLARRIEKT